MAYSWCTYPHFWKAFHAQNLFFHVVLILIFFFSRNFLLFKSTWWLQESLCVHLFQLTGCFRSFSKLYSLLKNGVWDWWHWTKITNHQKCWSMMVFIFISIFLNYTSTRIKCKVQLSNSRYTYKFKYIYVRICQLRVSRRKRFQVTNMQ